MTPDLQTTDPEILAAFLGQQPLLHALPRFPSREALLRAYADFQQSTFGSATITAHRCDLCQADAPTVGSINVTWSAHLRWRPCNIALFSLAFPFLVVLHKFIGAVGIESLLHKFPPEDRILFRTIHPFCKRCKARLRFRQILHALVAFLTHFLSLVGVVTALICGAFIVCGLTRAFNFLPRDATATLPYFLASLLAVATITILSKLLEKRILYPTSVRQLMKPPFAPSIRGGHFLSPMQITPNPPDPRP